MNDQLHASAFIEEAFGDDRILRRHRTEHGATLQNVFQRLFGTGVIQTAFLLEPRHGFSNCGLAR